MGLEVLPGQYAPRTRFSGPGIKNELIITGNHFTETTGLK